MNHQNRDQASAQEATPLQSEAAPSTRRYAPISDNGQAKFKEPRSWALNWCGFSLGRLLSAFCDRDGAASGEAEAPSLPFTLDGRGAGSEPPANQTGR